MYAYCGNNPVMYVDYGGEFSSFILGIALLIVAPYILLFTNITDGLSKKDSDRNQIQKVDGDITRDYGYYDIDVNELRLLGNNDIASIEAEVGVFECYTEGLGQKFTAGALILSGNSSLAGLGVGAYLANFGREIDTILFNREVTIRFELNIGVGVGLSAFGLTKIELTPGLGVAISIDWDP